MTKAESAASRTPKVDAAAAMVAVPFEREEKILFTEAVPVDVARALELQAADLRSCIKDLRERLAKARELMRMAADRIETCEEIISETSGRIFEVDLINELRALSQKGADHE